MSDSSFGTTQLRAFVARMQAGDKGAEDELLRAVMARLEALTHKMIRRFPGVSRWEDCDDVLQNATMRLLRALRQVDPANTRQFFGLAAEQIRRELLDMARHYYGARGLGRHHVSDVFDSNAHSIVGNMPQLSTPEDDLERWCSFHQEVERLPVEEREVVGLIYYHGWSHAEVAELLQMSVRTVGRHWRSSMLKLHDLLAPKNE